MKLEGIEPLDAENTVTGENLVDDSGVNEDKRDREAKN